MPMSSAEQLGRIAKVQIAAKEGRHSSIEHRLVSACGPDELGLSDPMAPV